MSTRKVNQAIMEWEHTGDGVDTTPEFRTEAIKGLYLKQYQIHTNASVTYQSNLIRNLGDTALTVNGSIVVDNIFKLIDQEIEFLFSNVALNETIKLIFVIQDVYGD